MKTEDIWIASIGAQVPPPMSTRQAVDEGLYDPESHDWHGWTGAAVAGDTPAPDLAIAAARQALERWPGGHLADVVMHLHAGAFTQGPSAWSSQHYVLNALGDCAAPSIRISQGCTGLLAGLELAAAYLATAPAHAAALLTGSDNVGVPGINRWSLGFQYGPVGDSGSALVLSRSPGLARLLAVGSASLPEAERVARGDAPIFPPSVDTEPASGLRRRLEQHRTAGESSSLALQFSEIRTETVLRTLAEANLAPGDISRVTHNFIGHERYLKSVLAPIGLSVRQGVLDYGRSVGHLTVNEQVIGLEHLLVTDQVHPGDHVLLLGFSGPTSTTCSVVRIERSLP
ncbi:3-oxoacyl-[acyl-carrier-protein] synthase III C-terminal domain-containing protein [Streptomyces sp. NBC_01296]|uniref:3-oxoacyl-[acyl-carrier-protein] synthase III C-terminal domain-containing protein n=1 Tax=Streptomyces sp. NBC_01296 TaxID=2903816 RepID=UPI002E1007E5|nr:3-oxoacyl-[acyl-carrier-protein] synthase III C-terminal domain-containing protein [Streptomyces sp. NBC_01296]